MNISRMMQIAAAGGEELINSVTNTDNDSGTGLVNSATFTSAALNLGTVPEGFETRTIVVLFSCTATGTVPTLSSATLGGVAMTARLFRAPTAGTVHVVHGSFTLDVPSGTSADFVLNFGASISRFGRAVSVYSVKNFDTFLSAANTGLTTSISKAVTLPSGGTNVVASFIAGASTNMTVKPSLVAEFGLMNLAIDGVDIGNDEYVSHGHIFIESAALPVDTTFATTGTTDGSMLDTTTLAE